MKRLFFMLLATLTLVACDKGGDDTPKSIELTGGTQTTQTIYADETEKSEGIKFKATSAWTATVTDVTSKAEDKDFWLKLSASEGKAGDITLAISLDKNNTGKDRKAEIHITCDGTTIKITVEQKATNKPEDPNEPKPEDPNKPKPTMRYVKKITSEEITHSEGRDVMTFEYDDKMRITKIIIATYSYYTRTIEGYFTYKDNIISVRSQWNENGSVRPEEDWWNITLNTNGTARQSIMTDIYNAYVAPQGIYRSAASKEATAKYKMMSNYTYNAHGYITKIAQSEERNGAVIELNDYLVTWNNGNLSKIQSTKANDSDEFKYSNIENKPCNWDLSLLTIKHGWSEVFDMVGQLGLVGKRSKHLPLSLTSTESGNIEGREFAYTLDEDGYIISCNETRIDNPTYASYISIHNTTIEYVK